MYILSLPVARAVGFAPRSTVHDYLGLWNWDHAGSHPSCALPQVPRESRARSQPHGLHHRQECEKPEKGGRIDSHGFDAGKLIKGKKRHVLVDLKACSARHRHRRRRSGSRRRSRAAGDLVRSVSLSREIVRRQRSGAGLSPRPGRHPARSRDEIVKRSDRVKGFVVQPRVVEGLKTAAEAKDRTSTATARLHQARVHSTHARKLCNPHKVSGRTLRSVLEELNQL